MGQGNDLQDRFAIASASRKSFFWPLEYRRTYFEIHLIRSGEAPGGIGETGATAGSPALRNAIYAATGVALRRLPIDRALIAGKKS